MSRPLKTALLLACLVTFPLGLGACGGGDEEAPAPAQVEEPASGSITEAELISAGDNICVEVNAAVGTIQSSDTSDPTVVDTQIAALYSGVAERLNGLGVPSDGDAPTDVIAAANTLGDPATTDTEAALAQFQAAAAEYGFTDCADDPSAPLSSGGDTGSGDDGTGATVEPAPAPGPEPAPAPAPEAAPTEPPTGGGVVPAPPDSGGSSGGSSGGISPG